MEFNSSNFLVPHSSQDRNIQIRDVTGVVIYTISPCDVSRTYALNNLLKIQTATNTLSIPFSSSSESNTALSLLNVVINSIISIFPCGELFSAAFSSTNFLAAYTSQDNSIQIRNTSGEIVYIISHCDVSNTYVSSNTLKVRTTNGLVSIGFSGFGDASDALLILNTRIEELKVNFPCGSNIDSATTSNFTSGTFLLPYGDGDRKVQVRNTLGEVVFNIDPCSVVVTYIKDSGKMLTIKSIGNPNLIHMDFASNSDAAIALTALQGRIDYIKSIYPCDGSAGFTYIQSLDSDVWQINHKLNRRPSVFVMDANYEEIEGLIVNIDNNNTNIYFNTDISGSAYLI